MKAILKKTVNSDFRAGDIIVGENSRIKRLVDSNIVIKDSSLLANFWSIVSLISSFSIILFLALMNYDFVNKYVNFEITTIWTFSIIFVMAVSFALNMAYFLNYKIPYTVYFLSFITNIFSGIFIMIGHENISWKYQNKNMAAFAALSQIILALICMSSIALALVDINYDIFYSVNGFANIFMFTLFILTFFIGLTLGSIYDTIFNRRRKNYISFIRKTNAKIEYKTKALNSYKAYLKTGNADKYLEENIELLEQTLKKDRERIK